MRNLLPKFCAAALGSGRQRAGRRTARDGSGGFTAAYKLLGPRFAATTGNTLDTALGPSMGKSPEAIPNRLARGGRRRRHHGRLCAGRPDQAGQGHPRIARRAGRLAYRRGRARRLGKTRRRFPEGLKQALLHAKSIAYSDSASGVYIERELFRKLGIEDQVKSKAKMIPRIPVASVVANGDYEIGFQQVSELLPVKGRPSSARSPNRCSRSRASRPASLSARSIRRKRRRCSTISRRPTCRPT